MIMMTVIVIKDFVLKALLCGIHREKWYQ